MKIVGWTNQNFNKAWGIDHHRHCHRHGYNEAGQGLISCGLEPGPNYEGSAAHNHQLAHNQLLGQPSSSASGNSIIDIMINIVIMIMMVVITNSLVIFRSQASNCANWVVKSGPDETKRKSEARNKPHDEVRNLSLPCGSNVSWQQCQRQHSKHNVLYNVKDSQNKAFNSWRNSKRDVQCQTIFSKVRLVSV